MLPWFLPVFLSWTTHALASTTTCVIEHVHPHCALAEQPWPPNAQPTFAMRCVGCAQALPDAANLPCSEVHVTPDRFSLKVEGVTLQGGRFESTSNLCPVRDFASVVSSGNGTVFRYIGPLIPGKAHAIHHASHSYSYSSSFVSSFTVSDTPDGGSGCAIGRTGTPGDVALTVLGLALVARSRRRKNRA
jgi:hypothetical protein